VTIPTGGVIFVTPNAAFTADIGGLLRHELSHAVLNQNRSLLSVGQLVLTWRLCVVVGQGVHVPGESSVVSCE
jgi:uncharacterized protein YybS (DUF2232 family)